MAILWGSAATGQPTERKTPSRKAVAPTRQQDDNASLQGTWLMVLYEEEGIKMTVFKNAKMVIAGDVITFGAGGSGPSRFKLDPTKTPKEFTLFTDKGKDKGEYPGIYRLDGDKLTLCWVTGGKAKRPTDFGVPKASGRRLYRYVRDKEARDNRK
jgi:uncharacterized protein (TIGR03067 family)